jgi:hypothetical protein
VRLTHIHPVPELAAAANGASSGGAAATAAADHTLTLARMVRVLYLNNNALSATEDLSFAADTLSHLYLQQNNIERLEAQHLLPLRNLEKLYLGGNCIQVLEGFAPDQDERQQQQQQQQNDQGNGGGGRAPPQPFYLVELHMDAQRLPPSQSLQLHIPSMQALSLSLTTLSLQHNQMDSDSILPISLLSRLTLLNLSHNAIDDLRTVGEMVSYLPSLTNLDLRSNPINSGPGDNAVTHKKYRDKVIMSARNIQMLDEKEVSSNQREFLHSLAEQKRMKRAQAQQAAAAAAGGADGAGEKQLSAEEAKFAALHKAPIYPYAPKVLTLRSTGQLPAGSHAVSVGAVGGMGAGPRNTLHAGASSSSSAQQGNFAPFRAGGGGGGGGGGSGYGGSPFMDYDDNLDGGGGGYGGGGGGGGLSQYQSHLAASSSSASAGAGADVEGTASSMTFTGDPTRLNDLLQQRGLVSAFGSQSQTNLRADALSLGPEAAESARLRRASMNSLNQNPVGWDGGRRNTNTKHDPPNNNTTQQPHQRKQSGGGGAGSGPHSRTGSRGTPAGKQAGK